MVCPNKLIIMKKIQPFNFWKNGKTLTANYFYLICSNDNLQTTAIFTYNFYNEINGNPGNIIESGNITMSGNDYIGYNTNQYAINWAANILGVTIIN
jgi:hypothetical protein